MLFCLKVLSKQNLIYDLWPTNRSSQCTNSLADRSKIGANTTVSVEVACNWIMIDFGLRQKLFKVVRYFLCHN